MNTVPIHYSLLGNVNNFTNFVFEPLFYEWFAIGSRKLNWANNEWGWLLSLRTIICQLLWMILPTLFFFFLNHLLKNLFLTSSRKANWAQNWWEWIIFLFTTICQVLWMNFSTFFLNQFFKTCLRLAPGSQIKLKVGGGEYCSYSLLFAR